MNSSSPSFSISEPSNTRYCTVYPTDYPLPLPLYCTVPLPGPQWPCSLCTKVLSSDQGQEAARCSSVSSPGLASQHRLTLAATLVSRYACLAAAPPHRTRLLLLRLLPRVWHLTCIMYC